MRPSRGVPVLGQECAKRFAAVHAVQSMAEAPLWYDGVLMLLQQVAFAGYGILASAAFSRERAVRPEAFALARDAAATVLLIGLHAAVPSLL